MKSRSNSLRIAQREFGRDRRGGIAVEFALGIPILLLLLSGVIDLGVALNQSSSLSNAARAGAQYAMRFPSDSDGISDTVKKSVTYDPSALTVNSSVKCECSDGIAVVCTDKCSGDAPQSYVTVTVSMPYSSPLPTGMLLGISTISGSAVFRAN